MNAPQVQPKTDKRRSLSESIERKLAPGEQAGAERAFRQLVLPSRRSSLIRAVERLSRKHAA